jgi:hypothetical protein
VPLPFKFPTETLHVFLLHTRHTSHLPIVVLPTHFLTKILYMFLISPYEPCIALSWIIPSSGLSRGVRWLDTDVSVPSSRAKLLRTAWHRVTTRKTEEFSWTAAEAIMPSFSCFPLKCRCQSMKDTQHEACCCADSSNGVTLLAVSSLSPTVSLNLGSRCPSVQVKNAHVSASRLNSIQLHSRTFWFFRVLDNHFSTLIIVLCETVGLPARLNWILQPSGYYAA